MLAFVVHNRKEWKGGEELGAARLTGREWTPFSPTASHAGWLRSPRCPSAESEFRLARSLRNPLHERRTQPIVGVTARDRHPQVHYKE